MNIARENIPEEEFKNMVKNLELNPPKLENTEKNNSYLKVIIIFFSDGCCSTLKKYKVTIPEIKSLKKIFK